LFVAYDRANHVNIFDLNGTFLRSFVYATPQYRSGCSRPIIRVADGLAFIGVRLLHFVHVFRATDCQFVRQIGSQLVGEIENAETFSVSDLAAKNGLLYVSDYAENRVSVLDFCGVLQRHIAFNAFPRSISVASRRLYVALAYVELGGTVVQVCHLDGFVSHTIVVPFFVEHMEACDDWVAMLSSHSPHARSLALFDRLGRRFPSPPISLFNYFGLAMCLNDFVAPPLHRKKARATWTPRHVEVDSGLRIVDQFSDDLIDIVLSYVGHGLFLCSYSDNELWHVE
jgi:hypothetical protein